MVSNEIKIDAGQQDMKRPAERPPKTSWKTELIRRTMQIVQIPFPGLTAKVLWYFFTKPVKARFNSKQIHLLEESKVTKTIHQGHQIIHYQWGESSKKVLLSHGWNSKIADFRKMIHQLVDAGYQVEGIDMKAHGKSEGTHTSLPEIRDILKTHYQESGPFEAIIGYSIGGLAAGLVCAELPKAQQPPKLILMAAPSHAYFIFEDTVASLGFRKAVLHHMTAMMMKRYHQPIDYFDIRTKQELLKAINIHLIYDEDDQTIDLKIGRDLQKAFPAAAFVHTKGLGHYKIIAYKPVNEYIIKAISDSAN